MSQEITIQEAQFKVFVYTMFSSYFRQFANRYARIKEEDADQILFDVVKEFWNQLQEGDNELMNKPQRAIEKIGAKEIVRFLKGQIPELNL